jgi:hypothetical protein
VAAKLRLLDICNPRLDEVGRVLISCLLGFWSTKVTITLSNLCTLPLPLTFLLLLLLLQRVRRRALKSCLLGSWSTGC